MDRFIHPRVESEIAFLLARDIEPPATVISVLAATDVIFGAVDVLDSRYEGFKFTLTDVVADNASAGGFYLGPVTRKPAEVADLRLIGCVVRVDGEVIMTAASAAVMGHPAASVAWLANQLAAQGEGLKAGQIIFSGGVTAPVPVVAGGSVTFEFAGWVLSRCPVRDGPEGTVVLRSTAVVPTEAPERYAKQLLSHLGRKAAVETIDGRGSGWTAGVRLRHRDRPTRE